MRVYSSCLSGAVGFRQQDASQGSLSCLGTANTRQEFVASVKQRMRRSSVDGNGCRILLQSFLLGRLTSAGPHNIQGELRSS